MIINPLSSILNGASAKIQNTTARIQNSIAALVSGKNSLTDNVANFSIATQLQYKVSGLRQANSNVSQASSLAQVAGESTRQITDLLDRAKQIATQANSGALNDDSRKALNKEFKNVLEQIDTIAKNTNFNGQKLLDGSLTGNNAVSLDSVIGEDNGGTSELSIQALDSKTLLGENANVLSQENAASAINSLNLAALSVASATAEIGSFQVELSFAAANIESAAFNFTAAESNLGDSDIVTITTQLMQDSVRRQMQVSLQKANIEKLAPSMLELVSYT